MARLVLIINKSQCTALSDLITLVLNKHPELRLKLLHHFFYSLFFWAQPDNFTFDLYSTAGELNVIVIFFALIDIGYLYHIRVSVCMDSCLHFRLLLIFIKRKFPYLFSAIKFKNVSNLDMLGVKLHFDCDFVAVC
jgi:hypothetical protein